MFAELKPYPDYKDYGVEWLGKVPAHRKQLPGRACYRKKQVPNTGLTETTVLSLSYGRIVAKLVEKPDRSIQTGLALYHAPVVAPHLLMRKSGAR